MGKITGVRLLSENCLHHACCVDVCPQVFQIRDDAWYAEVRPDARQYFESRDKEIRAAVAGCPIGIISITEDGQSQKL